MLTTFKHLSQGFWLSTGTFFLLLCPLLSTAQNLIQNPSAESPPDGNNWTVVTEGMDCFTGADWRIQGNQNGFPAAQEGDFLFYAGCGSNGEIYQDIDVSDRAADIDNGFVSFNFTGYVQSFNQSPTDEAQIIVEYKNGGGTVIATYDSGKTTSTGIWTQLTDTRIAPLGTRTIRVRLIAIFNGSGTQSNDGYFDNLSLTATLNCTLARLYVDASATGANNGSSWADALTDLQPALSSNCATEIWVAKGIYQPTEPSGAPDPRDKAFYLDRDVKVYGGFAGTETALSQRDLMNNVTILDGEIGAAGPSDNIKILFDTRNLSNAAIIDGFTMQRALSNGMANSNSYPTVTNCNFADNLTGMANFNPSSSSSSSSTSTIIKNCKFIGNKEGMDNYGGSLNVNIENCMFYNNGSTNTIGGISNGEGISCVIKNCTFYNSSGERDGVIWHNGTLLTVTNCTFYNNSLAQASTGSVITDTGSGSNVKLNNNVFYENEGNIRLISSSNIDPTSSNNAADDSSLGTLVSNGFVLLTTDPFVNSSDPDGADDKWCTDDDGLAILCSSPLVNAGTTPS